MFETKNEFIYPIIDKVVEKGAKIVTDNWMGYQRLDLNYEHFIVNHSSGDYGTRLIHTNTIEGFWSLLKRGIVGIYHSVSYKHLNHYCSEFAYRYNTRKITDAQRFHFSIPRGEGKRLKYKKLTSPFYGLM